MQVTEANIELIYALIAGVVGLTVAFVRVQSQTSANKIALEKLEVNVNTKVDNFITKVEVSFSDLQKQGVSAGLKMANIETSVEHIRDSNHEIINQIHQLVMKMALNES